MARQTQVERKCFALAFSRDGTINRIRVKTKRAATELVSLFLSGELRGVYLGEED